jgi:dimethylargininase
MNFTRAIVRRPGASFAQGITTSGLGAPEIEKTLAQHDAYCQALERCGLALRRLEADETYPDGTFVEDTAVLTVECAVLTRPGAASRQGEAGLMLPVLQEYYEPIYTITAPGSVEGGDICQAERRFLIGVSERTNPEGARQLAGFLERHGYTSSVIDCRQVPGLLHLKSGIAYLGEGRMAVIPALADHPELASYEKILVHEEEAYASNCVHINDYVLTAAGFPRFQENLVRRGYRLLALEVSEFQKMDGGLSCLSLRF